MVDRRVTELLTTPHQHRTFTQNPWLSLAASDLCSRDFSEGGNKTRGVDDDAARS